MDAILVPLAMVIFIGYHLWLWHKARALPLSTIIGKNAHGRRYWVATMMRDNDKKSILAVQTLRNSIMGSTQMATTSILLCSGLAAVISIQQHLQRQETAEHGELMVAIKYMALLVVFLFSFISTPSLRFSNQVNFLINCSVAEDEGGVITLAYVTLLLEQASALNLIGNRNSYVYERG